MEDVKWDTENMRKRQLSMHEDTLEKAGELHVGEAFRVKSKSRYDTQNIKRHLKKRYKMKWFEVMGRTEKDGNFYTWIRRTD